MTETRVVHREELDAMLAVMCEAFMLPFAPAREIFYRDPYFDIEKKRVLVKDGEVVSCLTIVDSNLWIGQSAVRVGGVAGVATKEVQRKHGYAARLLTDSLFVLAEQGYGLSALFPFSYPYYRRLGWERVGTQFCAHITPRLLPIFSETRYVRLAQPSDRTSMKCLYEDFSENRTGYCLRDEKRWNYLFDHAKNKIIYKQKQLEGYALYEIRDTESGQSQIRLLEMVTSTDAARRGLIGFFASRNDMQEIEYISDWEGLHKNGFLHPNNPDQDGKGPQIETLPGAMMRIIDFQKALEALRPNFTGFKGDCTLVLHDSILSSGKPVAITLEGDGTQINITAESGNINPRKRIEGDVRAWSSVLAGYHSLQDALALHRLRSYSESVVPQIAPLFPRREFFIPVADHF